MLGGVVYVLACCRWLCGYGTQSNGRGVLVLVPARASWSPSNFLEAEGASASKKLDGLLFTTCPKNRSICLARKGLFKKPSLSKRKTENTKHPAPSLSTTIEEDFYLGHAAGISPRRTSSTSRPLTSQRTSTSDTSRPLTPSHHVRGRQIYSQDIRGRQISHPADIRRRQISHTHHVRRAPITSADDITSADLPSRPQTTSTPIARL